MALAATDNLTLLEVMRTGDPAIKPGPAAQEFYHETVRAAFANPATRGNYLNNAWQLWKPVLTNVREWRGFVDKMAVRRQEFGAMTITVDAHGLPTAIQANPNDPQNELRFKRFRPEYRQQPISLTRDEYIPITVDPIEVGRLMAESYESQGASQFLANQLTQVLNTDRARELNTLMDSWAAFANTPNIYYVHTLDLDPQTIDHEAARSVSAEIQAAVFNLQDFTNRYSTAKAPQTVPQEQVRLVIANRAWRAIRLGYGTSYNPEYVFALPEDQIIVLPDQYLDSRADFAGNQIQWALVDAGTDQGDGGTFIVIDSLYETGADPYNIKQSYNQALRHASFLDLNPFKTLVHGGPGVGTQEVDLLPTPQTIALDVYTDEGIISPTTGVLPRGVQFSTNITVLDAAGNPAGGYKVDITGSTSPTARTQMLRYATGKISEDELSSTITITATSLINPAITISQSYTIGGPAPMSLATGATIVNPFTWPGTFTESTGAYVYTPATGVVYDYTVDGGATWTTATTSPITIPSGKTGTIRATVASGYIFEDNTRQKTAGPYTAA